MEIAKIIIGTVILSALNFGFYRMGFHFGKAAGHRESLKARGGIYSFLK